MLALLGQIFGSKEVISKGMDIIDDLHYGGQEKSEDERKFEQQKVKLKIEEKKAYHPYKLAQRVIAFSFVGTYIFIMLNGVLGTLYGIIDMDSVYKAMEFANKMFLGEITLVIITFYFGDAVVSKFKKGKQNETS